MRAPSPQPKLRQGRQRRSAALRAWKDRLKFAKQFERELLQLTAPSTTNPQHNEP